MRGISRILVGAGLFSISVLSSAAAFAQSGADFFNGKTINYIVASDAGGGYDVNARLLAEFMQKHLPGSTVIVRNMPGAGHVIGANYIYASEPDGLTLGTFNTGLIYQQLVGNNAIRFDLKDMSWVGKLATDPRAIVVTTQSGIESFEDLVNHKERIKFATSGVGSASTVETSILINTMNLPIDLISGYSGNEDQLALRRGEVQGILGSRSSLEQFVKDGHGRFIAQIGGNDPEVPQLADLTTDPAAQQAITLIDSQVSILRFTAGPPGIPEDRLQALRDAFQAAVDDPAMIERAVAMKLPLDPLVGDAVQEAATKALDQSEETIKFLKANM